MTKKKVCFFFSKGARVSWDMKFIQYFHFLCMSFFFVSNPAFFPARDRIVQRRKKEKTISSRFSNLAHLFVFF